MTEFLHMGGYAVYVWSAYGITLLVLVFERLGRIPPEHFGASARQRERQLRQLRRLVPR